MLYSDTAISQTFSLSVDLRFDNFNVNHKFPCDNALSLLRSKDGYIYAGCNGIYRFDGAHNTIFSNSNSDNHQLRGNYISDLVEDRFGRIWAGTIGGICYFDKTKERFIYFDLDTAHKIDFAYAVCATNNNIWFICNYGFTSLDFKTRKLGLVPGSAGRSTVAMYTLDSNTIFNAAHQGMCSMYFIKQNRFKAISLKGCHSIVTSVWKAMGHLWIGAYDGLWVADMNGDNPAFVKGTEKIIISDIVTAPALTGDSILWFGTLRSGLVLYNIRQRKIVYSYTHDAGNPFSLAGNEVNKLFVDDKNLVWVATDNGISLLNYQNQFYKEYFLPGWNIIKLAQDRYDSNTVWISVYTKGLTQIHWDTRKQLRHVVFKDSSVNMEDAASIYDMLQINKDRWLLLSFPLLTIWDSKTGHQQTITDFHLGRDYPRRLRMRYIIPYNKDTCFITSNAGLFICNLQSGAIDTAFVRHDLLERSELDLGRGRYDGAHTLWIATADGLMNYDLKTGTRIMYRVDRKYPLGNFLADAVVDSSHNRIYCASMAGILIVEIATGKYTLLDRVNDVKFPNASSIFIKDSIVWFSSTQGLISLNMNNRKWTIINTDQGYTSDKPFSFVSGEVVICLRNMYSYFSPNLVNSPVPSKPVIEKFTINGKPSFFPKYSLPSPLNYDQNNISIYFTAFEFNDPNHIKFRYRLIGLSNDWIYSDDSREANFIHLRPGSYSFVLQAGNRRGDWSPAITRFGFRITPPWWQTWWFAAIVVLGFIGIVVGIAAMRVLSIKKREQEKTAYNKSLAEMEMQVLLNQMNPHFIFNSLNSIQKFIWENKQEDAAEYLFKFSKLIRMILDNSMQKWITLEQELDALSLYLELEHRRCNSSFDYLIHIEQNIAPGNILFPSTMLQPYVENAIWHGLVNKKGHGVLKIDIAPGNGDMIRCTIEDNGIGRAAAAALKANKEKNSLSYGMQITRQRLEMMYEHGNSGSVEIEDIYDEMGTAAGTRIIIYVPVSSFVKI